MRISLIVALDRQGGIGFEAQLPWRLSADLRRFRALTMGHHLLLGRRTWESIGRPLPGRQLIVLSRQGEYSLPAAPDCFLVHSLEEGLALAERHGETELFIGGGAELYRLTLPLAHRLYLTEVATDGPADTFFPPWNPREWREVEVDSHPADERNQFPVRFRTLDRLSSNPA
jgi:dihydrofolate reductase